ncbi:MAG: hypothetical protein NVS3B14_13310 [Ktedonobacteraceae bacterium]
MAKKKIRVGIVFGGRSGEHEVSLASATSIIANLDSAKYETVPIGITKEGSWLLGTKPQQLLAAEQDVSQETGLASSTAVTLTGDPRLHRLIPGAARHIWRRWHAARAIGDGQCPLCGMRRAGFRAGHG